jgi:hypothetical protein
MHDKILSLKFTNCNTVIYSNIYFFSEKTETAGTGRRGDAEETGRGRGKLASGKNSKSVNKLLYLLEHVTYSVVYNIGH